MTNTQKRVEDLVDTIFQAIMIDIEKRYRISDNLSDTLSDTIPKHLIQALSQCEEEVREEVILLRCAYEELLELRGFLCDTSSRFDPDEEKLKQYWGGSKPEWEKDLQTLGTRDGGCNSLMI